MRKNILYIHLHNDYTGSTRILADIIKKDQPKYANCSLICPYGQQGLLDQLPVRYHYIHYHTLANKYWRTLFLLYIQWVLFFKICWHYRKQEELDIYINTLLPFGAALAGKLLGHRVIYHIHETQVRPSILQSLMLWVANVCATQVIYVSKYSQSCLRLPKPQTRVTYNHLSDTFVQAACCQQSKKRPINRTILMLSSLSVHKGIHVFVQLANYCPQYTFELVLSASKHKIQEHFALQSLPSNLHIYPAQAHVHPFYHRAAILLNLSDTQKWVESFGMTLLEGMFYGLPCIAPPVGGPTELIEDQKQGYLIDSQYIDQLVQTIELLMQNTQLYQQLSAAAQKRANDFF